MSKKNRKRIKKLQRQVDYLESRVTRYISLHTVLAHDATLSTAWWSPEDSDHHPVIASTTAAAALAKAAKTAGDQEI